MITLAWGAASHLGDWSVQEDGFWVDPARGWMILADGAGGLGVGDAETRAVMKNLAEGLGNCGSEFALRSLLDRECARVSGENGTKDPARRSAVSVLVARMSNGHLQWASGGSVGAVVVREGAVLPLVAPQVITVDGLALPLRAVGVVSSLSFQCGVFTLRPGDLVMAWTGGFPVDRGAFPSALLQAVGARIPGDTLQPLAEQLVEGAWAGEGLPQGNRSCVLAEWPSS